MARCQALDGFGSGVLDEGVCDLIGIGDDVDVKT